MLFLIIFKVVPEFAFVIFLINVRV